MERRAKRIFEIIISLAVVVYFFSATWLAVRNKSQIPAVASPEFETWTAQNSPVVIDLRQGKETRAQPLEYEPAIHIPFLYFASHIDDIRIPGGQKVLFVCSDGNRARLIANLMHKKGIRTYYLKSGLQP